MQSSLPSGGAGVSGESAGTPRIDSTGALFTQIPLDLPKARGASQPQLGLRYQSDLAVRDAGAGWGLGLRSIEPQPLSGPPHYDASDRMSYGGKPLIQICVIDGRIRCDGAPNEQMPRWSVGWRYYRLQVEGLFARFFWSPAYTSWRVQLRDGQTLEFGDPVTLSSYGSASWDIDSKNAARIHRWNLVRQYDTQGGPNHLNAIVYLWKYFSGSSNREYLTDVFYTLPLAISASGTPNSHVPNSLFAYHVRIAWEATPGQRILPYAPIWRRGLDHRIAHIDVTAKVSNTSAPREAVRRYWLKYLGTRGVHYDPRTQSPLYQRTFLKSVQVEGRCPDRRVREDPITLELPDQPSCPTLPPFTMDYTPGGLSQGIAMYKPLPLQGSNPPSVLFSNLDAVAVIDVDGDGVSDIVQGLGPAGSPSDGVHVFLNRGEGTGSIAPFLEAQIWKASEIRAAIRAPTANSTKSFFSISRGLTMIGDWGNGIFGNGAGTSIIWTPPDKPYPQYCAVTIDLSAKQWAYKSNRCTSGASGGPTLSLIGDLDGDGLIDGYGIPGIQNDPTVYFSRRLADETSSLSVLQGTRFSLFGEPVADKSHARLIIGHEPFPPSISEFTDMNGDGIADYVTQAETSIPIFDPDHFVYYPGNGAGRFECDTLGEPCEVPLATVDPRCAPAPPDASCKLGRVRPTSSDPQRPLPKPGDPLEGTSVPRVLVHDINGDGLSDILEFHTSTPAAISTLTVWLNMDGKAFQRQPDLLFADSRSPQRPLIYGRIAFADMNGDGIDDIVLIQHDAAGYISLHDEMGTLAYQVDAKLPIQTGVRPGLLSRLSNGLGTVTTFTYGNTANLDADAAGWNHSWSSHSRISAPVILEVATTDGVVNPYGISRRITYDYRDPAFDPWQDRLIGFRRITIYDAGGGSGAPGPNGSVQIIAGNHGLAVQTTYGFGPCQPMTPTNCPFTSDDDPFAPVTGVPLVVDTFSGVCDQVGGCDPAQALAHFSTTHYAYDWRELFEGVDGRHVRFAYVKQTDTYLYDQVKSANGAAAPDSTQMIDYSVPIPQLFGGDHVIGAAAPTDISRDVPIWVPRAAAHLRTELAQDDYGNTLSSIDRGRIKENGSAIDAPIEIRAKVSSHGYAGWMWRVDQTILQGDATNPSRERNFSYDEPTGDLVRVDGVLRGTVPLNRSHETALAPTASAPAGASNDQTVVLMRALYDGFGQLIKLQGPRVPATGTLISTGCELIRYDGDYGDLPTRVERYAARSALAVVADAMPSCGPVTSLSETYSYDRGLGVITASIDSAGRQSRIEMDGFGRPVAIFRPDPTSGNAESSPSTVLTYVTAENGPVQKVMSATRTGRAADGTPVFRTDWTYFDGLGNPLLTLHQADPAHGDGGNWVVSGLEPLSNGQVVEEYPSWFYSGAPDQHPLAAPSRGSPLSTYYYDPLGRVVVREHGNNAMREEVDFHALSADYRDGEDTRANGAHSDTPSSVYFDGHSRVSATVRREHADQGLREITTSFGYTPAGEISYLKQSASGVADKYVRWAMYDSFGRMVLNAEPNASTGFTPNPAVSAALRAWRYAYNDAGLLVGTSDPRGCGINFSYDGFIREVAEDYSPCLNTQAAYTPANSDTGAGAEVYFHYDTPEDGQTTDFGAKAAFLQGALASVRDLGAHTRFAYDGLGRLVRVAKQMARPDLSANPSADRYSGTWYRSDTTFDDIGRVVSLTSGATLPELRGSDGRGEVTFDYAVSAPSIVRAVAGSYGPLITQTLLTADGLVRSRNFGDAAQTVASFEYDDLMRPTHYRLSRSAPALWVGGRPGYVPPAPGSPNTRQVTLEDQRFSYDNASNLTSLEDLRPDADWPAGARPSSVAVTYDDLYRVTSAAYGYGSPIADAFVANPGPPAVSMPAAASPRRASVQSFAYDWMNNTTRSSDDANVPWDRSLGTIANGSMLAGPNQIRSATFGTQVSYDAAGNVTLITQERSGPCTEPSGKCNLRLAYDWDEVGRLVRARRWDTAQGSSTATPTLPPASDVSFTYGVGGIVYAAMSNPAGARTYDVNIFTSLRLRDTSFDSSQADFVRTPASEQVEIGSLANVAYDPTLPTGDGTAGHVFLRFSNEVGSTSDVVDKGTGELVQHLNYLAFGALDADYHPDRWRHQETRRFQGKESLDSVGVVYFGARFYSPQLGRWMSPDPLTIHGFGSDLNPYAFVGGAPFDHVDPFGLDECSDSSGGTSCQPSGSIDMSGDGGAASGPEPGKGLIATIGGWVSGLFGGGGESHRAAAQPAPPLASGPSPAAAAGTYAGPELIPTPSNSYRVVQDPASRSSAGGTPPIVVSDVQYLEPGDFTELRAAEYPALAPRIRGTARIDAITSHGTDAAQAIITVASFGTASFLTAGMERAGLLATEGIDAGLIRFSQSNVRSTLPDIVSGMKANGWQGAPIDVVRMADGSLTAVDNTRLLAASLTDTPAQVTIREFDELFTAARAGGNLQGETWGEAVLNRIAGQKPSWQKLYPNGSPFTGIHPATPGFSP